MDPKKESRWKKAALIGVLAMITPGGFIVLGAYGLKKLLDKSRKKDKDESSV